MMNREKAVYVQVFEQYTKRTWKSFGKWLAGEALKKREDESDTKRRLLEKIAELEEIIDIYAA